MQFRELVEVVVFPSVFEGLPYYTQLVVLLIVPQQREQWAWLSVGSAEHVNTT